MKHQEAEFHLLPYGVYVKTWVALVLLTFITVGVAGISLGFANVLVALLIAAVKSSLVLAFFMHLKFEERTFFLMLLLTIVTLAIILSLTFSDIAFR